MSFCEHVMTRQVALFDEYSATFPNIYKDRVKEYIKPASSTILAESTQFCKTNESPEAASGNGTEDVEMLDETEVIPCAQTFDDRRRHYNTNGGLINGA